MTASPTSCPDPSAAVLRIALQVGATPVAHLDIATMLSGVCSALPAAAGVASAVVVLTEPADPRDPASRQVFASDDAAHHLGLLQHRAGRGPAAAAVRGDRPLVVPDLAVSGPPELAAAAADCGLVSSLVVPLPGPGRPAGGLQVLAGADTSLDERTASLLWPLVSAMAARLADARELARVSAPAVDDGGESGDSGEETASELTSETATEPTAESAEHPADHDAVEQTTARLQPVAPAEEQAAELTERDPVTDLFAAGGAPDETPPTGQVRLGGEGPEPTRAVPARIPVLGRIPRPADGSPAPATVPAQRSGPVPAPVPERDVTDGPTRRVPRHRLRDET